MARRPIVGPFTIASLRPAQWWAELGKLPVIGNPKLAGEATIAEAVLCEVGSDEVAGNEWRLGYYLLDLSPAEVSGILGSPAPAFPSQLGGALALAAQIHSAGSGRRAL
jgi:hypothetical protein